MNEDRTEINYHPCNDDSGSKVVIHEPHVATGRETWDDPNSVAIFTPLSCVPTHFKNATGNTGRFVDEPDARFQPSTKRRSAGTVIIETDGRVWLTCPTNKFGGYHSTFPKGTQERGQTLQDTAIRETYEETGLAVGLTHYLGDYERSMSIARMYVAVRSAGNPSLMGWETQAMMLVPQSQVHSHLNSKYDYSIWADVMNYLNYLEKT